MLREEIYKELTLSYDDLIDYLLKKYGGSNYDYFCNDECKSENKKAKRTEEGLFCHHIDEDKGGNLSNEFCAKGQPYEWQKSTRLVYCNILEHLILHIKIAVLRQKRRLLKPIDIEEFFTTGGIFMICKDINDMFKLDENLMPWKKRCFLEIKENYSEYILILKILFYYIQNQYKGENKKSILKIGNKIYDFKDSFEILEFNEQHDIVLLKSPNGQKELYPISKFRTLFTYEDMIDFVIRIISKGYKINKENNVEFYLDIYEDIIKKTDLSLIENLSQSLLIDFHGYGFPQFTDDYINFRKFGSINIDEYISKAYPSFITPSYDIGTSKPRFWKNSEYSSEVPFEIYNNENIFYIVRVEASFNTRRGEKPFIRYKEGIYKPDEDNNCLYKRGIILRTSDDFDRSTGKRRRATKILTLTKDDYLLFKRKYTIRKITVLDGCYFQK